MTNAEDVSGGRRQPQQAGDHRTDGALNRCQDAALVEQEKR